MSNVRTFARVDGQWVQIANPTPEQQRSVKAQQAAMFTPDGQFRMVAETAERYRKIRQSQPQMSPDEMRAQLVRNRTDQISQVVA